MARKQTILKKHILEAALAHVKEEGFENFTARRIADSLNASTQPIYKAFKNMEDLKEQLIDYIKAELQKEVFDVSLEGADLVLVCANYLRFAKKEGMLFSALFMGKDYPSKEFNDFVLNAVYEVMETMPEFEDDEDRKTFLEIIWPSVHGAAVLSAQGQFDYEEQGIDNKAESIYRHAMAAWKKKTVV
ncbi:TetR/AcrR family transcriptional regulator [Alkalibacterium kapii]|uniref:TetR family transcriptional regulator n=1 Tax=Alkalibacterium kapii TaxID=426704 RepID=A0A511AYI6_9LACT|nr:TetR/AcrR family transcriptional regulator [Alkalibacterium kapii]GEK92211.1 TetR family transcriptional regulator [Alkalibacterium kapii]